MFQHTEVNQETKKIEETLLKIWVEVFRKKDIKTTDNFFEIGGDSKVAARLISKIKKNFNVDLPVSVLFRAPSIKEFAPFISSNNVERTSVVTLHAKGNATPFFLVGDIIEDLRYYRLVKYLGNDRPVYEFKIPRKKEYIPAKEFKKLATSFIQQMKSIQPEGPYFLGGSCIRGTVAYEMAQQLISAGDRIGLLALFEIHTPENSRTIPPIKYWEKKTNGLKKQFQSPSQSRPRQSKSIHPFRLLKSTCSIAYSIIDRSIFKIRYDYKPYPGKITLFKGTDLLVKFYNDDPYLGWRNYCPEERIELFEIPGKHGKILQEPGVRILANHLRECLNRSDKRKDTIESEAVYKS